MQPPNSLSQIPQSNKADIRRELEPKGDAYNSVPGLAGEGGGGKVKQLKERIDTEGTELWKRRLLYMWGERNLMERCAVEKPL
ncbi:hypothetical protein [Otoolea muris]|uniref:hypothetical protein n=1 Tax=Otoolea muris TaxID=2941515 RepID=UPI00203AEE4A|nr:hypothetical protein [Otoolea muris]